MNFQLREDAAVFRKVPGFQKIPFERIGLYANEYRATWPVSRAFQPLLGGNAPTNHTPAR